MMGMLCVSIGELDMMCMFSNGGFLLHVGLRVYIMCIAH